MEPRAIGHAELRARVVLAFRGMRGCRRRHIFSQSCSAAPARRVTMRQCTLGTASDLALGCPSTPKQGDALGGEGGRGGGSESWCLNMVQKIVP